MTRAYLELVGVQVSHSKPASIYRIDNLYVRRIKGTYQGTGTMQGYDMTLHDRFTNIVQAMMRAYAPVIKSVWEQDSRRTHIFFLQFVVAYPPEKLGLRGNWTHWAEW